MKKSYSLKRLQMCSDSSRSFTIHPVEDFGIAPLAIVHPPMSKALLEHRFHCSSSEDRGCDPFAGLVYFDYEVRYEDPLCSINEAWLIEETEERDGSGNRARELHTPIRRNHSSDGRATRNVPKVIAALTLTKNTVENDAICNTVAIPRRRVQGVAQQLDCANPKARRGASGDLRYCVLVICPKAVRNRAIPIPCSPKKPLRWPYVKTVGTHMFREPRLHPLSRRKVHLSIERHYFDLFVME